MRGWSHEEDEKHGNLVSTVVVSERSRVDSVEGRQRPTFRMEGRSSRVGCRESRDGSCSYQRRRASSGIGRGKSREALRAADWARLLSQRGVLVMIGQRVGGGVGLGFARDPCCFSALSALSRCARRIEIGIGSEKKEKGPVGSEGRRMMSVTRSRTFSGVLRRRTLSPSHAPSTAVSPCLARSRAFSS